MILTGCQRIHPQLPMDRLSALHRKMLTCFNLLAINEFVRIVKNSDRIVLYFNMQRVHSDRHLGITSAYP